MNKTDYKQLGDYIREVDVRNRDFKVTKLVGLTIDKAFIPSVANVIGTDLSNYKVIRKKQFACSLMQVSRDQKMPVAMFKEDEAIMSPAYPMFEVINENVLLPEYLMMWFTRKEFDREASFYAVGGVRGSLTWEDFMDMNNKMISRLEETAQTLYRKMFVDGIDKENLPDGWRIRTLGEIGEIISGATPSTENPNYWTNNGISWLSPADISRQNTKFISKGSKDITILGYKSCSTKLLPPNSILFSSRAPIGLMAISLNDLCTNQGFKSIIPIQDVGYEFIYYYLHSIRHIIAKENEGSTFNEISSKSMKELSIIIPCKEILSLFSKLMKPIFNTQKIKEQENKILLHLQALSINNIY